MKIKKLRKLLLVVLFLFFLNGCDEYNITYPIQGATTEIQTTEITIDIGTLTTTEEVTVEETTETEEELNTLNYEEQLKIAEELVSEYFTDYSNPDLTDEEIIEEYFYNGAFDGFYEERNTDLENETVLELVSIDFRIDGAFDISYRATTRDEQWERKRPGRIVYKSISEEVSIDWLQESSEIDELCDDLLDKDDTLTLFERYFSDYLNDEISNEELASMYYAGKIDEYIFSQREEDLQSNVSIIIIDVIEREEDSFFDIIYEVRSVDERWTRKRPGRTRYLDQRNDTSTLIIWKTDEELNTLN